MNFNIQVIHYSELLILSSATHFYKEIQRIFEAGVNAILIDLKNVTLINSSDLMALIEAFRAVQSANGKLFLCSMNEQTRILFELTGLDQVFDTFANLDEFNNTVLSQQIAC